MFEVADPSSSGSSWLQAADEPVAREPAEESGAVPRAQVEGFRAELTENPLSRDAARRRASGACIMSADHTG